LNTIKQPTLKPAEDIYLTNQNTLRFITYLYPVPANSNTPYATLMVLVEEATFTHQIRSIIENNSSNTIILDNNYKMITALNDDEYIYTKSFEDLVSTLNTYGSKIINYNNIDYFLSYVRSEDTDWTYITLVPFNDVMKEVSDLKN
jgi:hypothetical protein